MDFNKHESAQENFQKAIEALSLGAWQHAMSLFERIVELGRDTDRFNEDDAFINSHVCLGLMYAKLGWVASTIEYLEKAITLKAEPTASICHALGCCYSIEGRTEEAIEFLRRAVEFNEKDVMGRHFLISSYIELAQDSGKGKRNYFIEAKPHYDHLKALDPSWSAEFSYLFEANFDDNNRANSSLEPTARMPFLMTH